MNIIGQVISGQEWSRRRRRLVAKDHNMRYTDTYNESA